MALIAPSLLSADFTQLGRECREVLDAGASMLHFDVMDGHFVPNISVGVPVLASLAKKTPAVYDVHLMISHPLAYARQFIEAGADYLVFHYEAEDDPAAVLQRIQELGAKPGMAIKPATPAEALKPYLSSLSMALVMAVEPGFGGQTFQPGALEKIAWLKKYREEAGLSYLIEVDGGIDPATARAVLEAGADVLVAGSAVFLSRDRAEAIRALKAESQKA